MPKRNLLNKLKVTDLTLRRCYEIMYFISIKACFRNRSILDLKEFLKHLEYFTNVSADKLEFIYRRLHLPLAMPNMKEKVIALTYFGVTREDIRRLFGIHTSNVSKCLESYVESDYKDLIPKLSKEDDDIIKELYDNFTAFVECFRINRRG